MPLVLLGAGILWFGWFGFNAGSAVSAGQVAGYALVNTQLGACTAMLAWMGIEWWRRRKPSGVGIAAGAVAGLAAITPASGYVQPWAAIIIGAAAGLLCYGAVHLKDIFHYDDSLDVVGVHMVGGAIGVAAHRRLRQPRRERRRRGRGLDPARPPGSAGCRRNRLPVRHDLDHPVGHRPHRGAAGESRRTRKPASISASTPRSATSRQKRQSTSSDSMVAAPGAPHGNRGQNKHPALTWERPTIASWRCQRDLRLFGARRTDIEYSARDLDASGRARVTAHAPPVHDRRVQPDQDHCGVPGQPGTRRRPTRRHPDDSWLGTIHRPS